MKQSEMRLEKQVEKVIEDISTLVNDNTTQESKSATKMVVLKKSKNLHLKVTKRGVMFTKI